MPQASAQGVEVELAIVFTAEQSCTDGSDKLISGAFPFDVEACYSEGGSPLVGHEVYLEINHGDGAVELIDGVTDANGVVRSTVAPTSAGSTTVAACDAGGCYNSVELESDSDPPPPVTPYVPTGNDLGPSAALADAPLDMIDPDRGGEAGPEESSRHGGVDISALSYAGLVDGRATFKISMVDNGQRLFESGPPRWDMSLRVTTPEGTEYNLFVSNNNGELKTFAGDGVNDIASSADIRLEWSDDGHTACLSAAGVDVPPGSSVSVFAATSRDAESSGFYDELTGVLVAQDPGAETDDDADSGTATDTVDDGVDIADESPSGTPSTSTDDTDSGGFPILPIAVAGFVALTGGFWWWWSQREETSETPSSPATTPADDEGQRAPGTIKVLDSAGREIVAAVDDQQLRVRLELDIDPASAPDKIKVQIVGPDGTKETIEAERIDWGASRPLYQSELTTIDGTFSQIPDVLDPVLGMVGYTPTKVSNGEFVTFVYDDLSHGVQTFDSGLDARYWYTQSELGNRTQDATNRGINLTNGLRALREQPESEERSELEAKLESRLSDTRGELKLLERANHGFHNENYYAGQQIAVANYYMAQTNHDPRMAMAEPEVAAKAKEEVHGHIISGVKDIVVGGTKMLVESTGVAQARTVLTGDSYGQAVGWDGRATAFLDLVGDGFLQGASMKFQLDNLVAPTRPIEIDSRSRYTGPDPESLAPAGAIVDPTQMGMTPEAIAAAHRTARATDSYLLIRPTTPGAIEHRHAGAHPKPESLKSKTVSEIDTLIGMEPETTSLVGMFEPKTDFFESAYRAGGMSEADITIQLDTLKGGTLIDPPPGYAGKELWDTTAKRFVQRSNEFTGSTGQATNKMVETGEIRIDNGVIINAETGKPYTGDHDPFDYVDSNGQSVSPEKYARINSMLENSDFQAQHGAHVWWDPQRSDFPEGDFYDAKYETARGIYDKIIGSHVSDEILIVFSPVGPPTAIFSGGAPGPYLGQTPGPFQPVAPGSSVMMPTDIGFLDAAGVTSHGLTFDDSVQDWVEAETEFRSGGVGP